MTNNPNTPLAPGYHDIPTGHVAALVTHLEMFARPDPRPVPQTGLTLTLVKPIELARYRALFRRVGEPWMWVSRLLMKDDVLNTTINDPQVDVWVLQREGQDVGLLELDFRQTEECELMFFGLAPDMIGQGAGRQMLEAAFEAAFSRPVKRFHVHTCSLDSPQALAFYQRSGFVPISQKVEVFADPRLDGTVPRDAGRHVPIIA